MTGTDFIQDSLETLQKIADCERALVALGALYAGEASKNVLEDIRSAQYNCAKSADRLIDAVKEHVSPESEDDS